MQVHKFRIGLILTGMAALALSATAVALAQGSNPSNDASMAAPMSGAPNDDSAAGMSAAAQSSQTPSAQPGPDGVVHVTNGPVPDTPASRAANGAPMSNAGQHTAPAGN
jgi:hypothetical protein